MMSQDDMDAVLTPTKEQRILVRNLSVSEPLQHMTMLARFAALRELSLCSIHHHRPEQVWFLACDGCKRLC